MPETGKDVSVVVPVYNESALVETLLRRVRAALPEAELVVVDDCSTDGTGDVLARLAGDPGLRLRLQRHPVNRGKGAALRTGFAAVTGTLAVVQDADLEYDPTDLPAVLAPLRAGTADVVYGSRFLGDRARPLSWLHRSGNGLLTRAANFVTGLRLTDMETCYKACRTDLLRRLMLVEDRFGFDPEFTVAVARAGARIVEVPIGYTARTWAEGKKIGPRDVVRVFLVLARHGWPRLLRPGCLAVVAALAAAVAAAIWALG